MGMEQSLSRACLETLSPLRLNEKTSAVSSRPELEFTVSLDSSSQILMCMAKLQLLLPIFCSKSFAGFGVTVQMTTRNRFYFFMSVCMEDDSLQMRTELCRIKLAHLLLAPLGQCINSYKKLLKESLCSPLGQQ